MTVRDAESIDADVRTLDGCMSGDVPDEARHAWKRLRRVAQAAGEAARVARGDEPTREVPLPSGHRMKPGA